ncbi:MAG: hypothetical protein ACR2K5_06645 [Pseudolabrys sp.]
MLISPRHQFASTLMLLVLLLAPAARGQAQTPAVEVTRPDGSPAIPYIVERRQAGEAGLDPRRRLEMRLGNPRAGCPAWQIETAALRDGRVIFQLNEPADKSVILKNQYDPAYVELVIGDADCNYKIRIERNK